MLPRATSNNTTDCRKAHAVLNGEFFGGAARSVKCANATDVRLRKFGLLSSLDKHVGRVLFWCSEEQVTRVAAQRIVAMVTNKQAVWNLAIRQYPSIATRVDTKFSRHCENASVPETPLTTANPIPTRGGAVGLINKSPKPYFDGGMGVADSDAIARLAPGAGGLNGLSAINAVVGMLSGHFTGLLTRDWGVSRPGALQRCRVIPLLPLYQKPHQYGEIGGAR